MRRLEPSEEPELESSKEVDSARAADVKMYQQSSRAHYIYLLLCSMCSMPFRGSSLWRMCFVFLVVV